MVNQPAVTKRIIWTTIAIWLSIDGAVVVETTAQTQRRSVVMPQERQEEANTDLTTRVAEYVLNIARNVSGQGQNLMVDLVFIVDGSRSMMDKITAIEEILPDVADAFDEELIDCRFSFQRLDGAPRTRIQPFASDLLGQVWFRKLRLRPGNSAPRYGLDIILQTLRRINFRPDASKHLLVVTHSNLQTAWAAKDAKDRIVRHIIDQCKQDDIHINAVGVSEPAQIQLTSGTDGKFYSVSDNDRSAVKFHSPADLDRSILETEGIFKLTAQHIAATALQPPDIVFMFDSSFSMETKVEKICRGIDEMVNVLAMGGVGYRFGVIRFWAASGGGQSVILTTKPPIDVDQVKHLFRIPKRGDEHLLDAVIEGVPKLKTPKNRQLVLVIVTDEPPSRRADKGYTVEQAVDVCRKVRAQVNVIGASSMRNDVLLDRMRGDMIRVVREKMPSDMLRNNPSSATYQNRVPFEKRVSQVTNGVYYVMLGAAIVANEKR